MRLFKDEPVSMQCSLLFLLSKRSRGHVTYMGRQKEYLQVFV